MKDPVLKHWNWRKIEAEKERRRPEKKEQEIVGKLEEIDMKIKQKKEREEADRRRPGPSRS